MSTFSGFIRRVRRRLPRPRQHRPSVAELGSPELAAHLSDLRERVGAVNQRLNQIEAQLRSTTDRAEDAHRLAVADARGIEQLLQAEIQLWQAIDADRSDDADQLAR
jgi:hypothetical protein